MTIIDQYFNWLRDIVIGDESREFNKLMRCLFETTFVPIVPMDENRAAHGVSLRYQFAKETGHHQAEIAYYLDNQDCSIFEMMVALACRCETIMDDYQQNRTPVWFWDMVKSLGMDSMTDDVFSLQKAKDILETFNNREYAPNGVGGLFTVPWYEGDLRDLDIWYQMQAYLQDKN